MNCLFIRYFTLYEQIFFVYLPNLKIQFYNFFQKEFSVFIQRLKLCSDPSIRSLYEPLWMSLANLSYDLDILIEEMDSSDGQM